MRYEINHLKVYKSVSLSTITMLCNHHLHLLSNTFISPKGKTAPSTRWAVTISPPPHHSLQPPPLATISLLSLSMDLFILSVSYSIYPIGVMLLGPHASPLIIIVFTGINIFVPIFTIFSGFIKGDLHNWKLTEQDYRLNISGSSDIYRLGGYDPWPE